MMYYILCIISSFMNLFSRMVYYDTVFSKKQNSKRIYFWLASIAAEIILYFNTILLAGIYSTAKALITISVCLIINYSLTLFYQDAKFLYRFLMAVSLQAIYMLAEIGSGGLLCIAWTGFTQSSGIVQNALVTVLSGIVSFFIILVISTFWKNNADTIALPSAFLTLATPLCSIILIAILPYDILITSDYIDRLFPIFQILLLLNMINYHAINSMLKQARMKMDLLQQSKQLKFQSDKYEQISNAYRNTRRIVHEVKRYNSYITACAEQNDCDKILQFVRESGNDIEERFIKINTGNLVIDTLISNLYSSTTEASIKCSTEINIDKDDIPVNDYDLCIILGNLIDNCMNACKKLLHNSEHETDAHISLKMYTKQNFFVIYAENSTSSQVITGKTTNNLYHGFGISNIQETVTKYHGAFYCSEEAGIFESTVSIPILRDSAGNMHPIETLDTPVPLSKAVVK